MYTLTLQKIDFAKDYAWHTDLFAFVSLQTLSQNLNIFHLQLSNFHIFLGFLNLRNSQLENLS